MRSCGTCIYCNNDVCSNEKSVLYGVVVQSDYVCRKWRKNTNGDYLDALLCLAHATEQIADELEKMRRSNARKSASHKDKADAEETNDIVDDVIDYFNSVCHTKYKKSTSVTRKHIKNRINEGFIFDDFRQVIEKKHKQWLGTDMEKYLRPETLFGTKFEGYLNEPEGINGDFRSAKKSLFDVMDEI